MARFDIQRAPEKLGVVPTTAVRANLDVSTGGAALGQAIAGAGLALQQIRQKRQQMTDGNSSVEADRLRSLADEEFKQFKLVNPQETWENERLKQTVGVGEEVAKLNFSPNALSAERQKSKTYSDVSTARALTDATFQLRKDTIDAQTESLVGAFRSGNPEKILEATKRYNDNGANMGKDKAEVLSDIKAARAAGEKLRSEDAISNVHAAMEAASNTGDFTLARELAKNQIISEPQQTTLRNAINSAETRFREAKLSLGGAIQDQTMTGVVDQLAENPNATGQEDFDALPLNDTNKSLLAEKINDRTTVIESGKPDPWIETTANQAATSAISRVLDGTREEVAKISTSEIISKLGIITPSQVSELITKRTKRLDSTNIINTPSHRRAVGALNRLRGARLVADDVKDDIELRNEVEGEFGRMQNELEAFAESIKEDPDFDAKILKKQQLLGRPIIEEVTLNWFEKMFSPKEQGFFTAVGFNTEAEELIQEKFDILKDQKAWKTMTDAEKESARLRFEQGQTVQEILDLLSG